MAIPELKQTILDGALGIAPTNTTGVLACIGNSSAGDLNTVKVFSDPKALKDHYGYGPLVEFATLALLEAGGPIVCVRATNSTAGTNSAVTKTGTGTSVATLTGAPYDHYQAIVKITTAASALADLTATFQYSLDNGRTWSGDINIPVSGVYLIPNTGITITFAAGTFVVGTTYTWTSVAPSFSTGDFATAADALLDDESVTWFGLHAIAVPADATAGLALFGALASVMADAQTRFRNVMGFMNAEDASTSATKTNYAAQANNRISLGYGFENVTSPISKSQYKRPAIWSAATRASQVPPGEDLAQVSSGNLTQVTALLYNEAVTPEMDAARFTTLRSIIGKQGYYVTNGRIFSAAGSDFQYIQHRRVMDIFATTARSSGLQFLNSSVRVKQSDGTILEADARTIESYIESACRTALIEPQYATDLTVVIDRTNNILSSNTLRMQLRVIPKGYAKFIEQELGFQNPKLLPLAA
jgi:hypothetical protein